MRASQNHSLENHIHCVVTMIKWYLYPYITTYICVCVCIRKKNSREMHITFAANKQWVSGFLFQGLISFLTLMATGRLWGNWNDRCYDKQTTLKANWKNWNILIPTLWAHHDSGISSLNMLLKMQLICVTCNNCMKKNLYNKKAPLINLLQWINKRKHQGELIE